MRPSDWLLHDSERKHQMIDSTTADHDQFLPFLGIAKRRAQFGNMNGNLFIRPLEGSLIRNEC